ncbi:histidine phosphatase family protein [Shewanella eurypsychrophilus]|uniref:Histidine phosphatase family protein n=1 Tax=Shewanella eurypsychrophilus TaxID=2593656 RepID=A0ABX6V3E6_9GAMM|nr:MULTISPECIES: phosphoglycerate mutase family protein [Shewanella]QFU21519.1 histidine phosphatase family protein [Shewanella sp. YLB-09]QPG56809.1 histidine phosphatase family protein [Shewanella eurypsychrophilus]
MRFFLVILAFCLSVPQTSVASDKQRSDQLAAIKTIILVRHAEKAPGATKDPSLSEAGDKRAQALIAKLADQPLSLLLSSPYKRTQETLAPISSARDLEIKVIDTKAGLKEHIKASIAAITSHKGNVLIAGHSNTVPLIISALGGPKIKPITEEQYSNIYYLRLYQSGKVELEQQEYSSL